MYFAIVSKKKIIKIICILTAIILAFGVFFGFKLNYVFAGVSNRELPIYRVDREDKVVAISFDCAWGTDYTDKLLEIMEKRNVKCTFLLFSFGQRKTANSLKKLAIMGTK